MAARDRRVQSCPEKPLDIVAAPTGAFQRFWRKKRAAIAGGSK
jgi:hypothetical protein